MVTKTAQPYTDQIGKNLVIRWNDCTINQWQQYLAKTSHSNLLQDYPYAAALRKTERWTGRFGVIYRHGEAGEDTPIGLMHVSEQRWLRLFHAVRIHRAPLWLDYVPNPATEAEVEQLYRSIAKIFPKRPWRKLAWMPEMPASAHTTALMKECGFTVKEPGYHSIWLDLEQEEAGLRANLRRNTRHHLSRAEKAEQEGQLVLKYDWLARDIPWLMEHYRFDKHMRAYQGLSVPMTIRMRHAALPTSDGGASQVLLLIARLGTREVAGQLYFLHGCNATQQISWSDASAREAQATTWLNWQAICLLKERGVRALDLGGVNPKEAPGLTEFKRGFGGEAYELAGIFTYA